MKPTVEQGLTGRAVEAGQETEVFNREVVPVLSAVRDAANFRSVFKVTGNTSDSVGAFKAAWESEQVPTIGTWSIRAHVALSDSTNAGAAYGLAATYQMVAGVPTLISSTALYSHESAAAFDFQWSTSATTVILSVQDAGAAASYAAVVEVLEVVP